MRELINNLRSETQAGVVDCMNALKEANGDYQKALEILKAKMIDIARKKSENELGARGVFSVVKADEIAMLEVYTQTDFVIKNDEFCNFFFNELSSFLAISSNDINDVEGFSERILLLSGKMGENIQLGRMFKFKNTESQKFSGYFNSSINGNFFTGENKLSAEAAVIITNKIENQDLLNKIAMHVYVNEPTTLTEIGAKNADGENVNIFEQKFFSDESMTIKKVAEKNEIEIFDFRCFK